MARGLVRVAATRRCNTALQPEIRHKMAGQVRNASRCCALGRARLWTQLLVPSSVADSLSSVLDNIGERPGPPCLGIWSARRRTSAATAQV